jgi:hypothetical protein
MPKQLFVFLLVCLSNTSFGQNAQMMYWALNKCPYILYQTSQHASAAYSMRKTNCAYTGYAMQVRKGTATSGTTTMDIGFTANGFLDTATLKSFLTSSSGYVAIWYDQSGNGKHLTQATNSRQPRIANFGIIDRVNGMPTLTFQDTTDLMLAPSMDIQSFSAVRKVAAGGASSAMRYLVSIPANFDFSIRSSSAVTYYYGDNNTDDFWTSGKIYINDVNTAAYPSTLHALYAYTGTLKTATSFSLSSTFMNRGMYGGDAVSELIVYPSVFSLTEIMTVYLHQAKYYNLP